MMDKQEIRFATVTSRKEVVKIGRATAIQPRIQYAGTGIKWLDDGRLLKKGGTV